MTTNFRINGTDTDDLFVRKDIFTEGGLWGWGDNTYGQLGDNTITHRSSPVQTVAGGTNWKEVACGDIHMAAIKTDGTLWSWGAGWSGELGNNETTHRSSPVQTVSGGTNWKQVACGTSFTAAIKTDGTLWLWGANFMGSLGDNTSIVKYSPVQTVSGGTNWKQVSCGNYHTAAIKTDGTLWLWGQGTSGQLGDNTTVTKSSPVQTIAGGTNWKQVACGYIHTAAVKTDGTLWVWGYGEDWGQIGDGTRIGKSSPVQTASGGTNWKQVSGGFYHTAAVKTDGTLWLWGRGSEAQISDYQHRSTPVQVVGGGRLWKYVSCGDRYTIAIKTDGTLFGWGYNVLGQLGNGTTYISGTAQVQTVSGGTNWKIASAGSNNTIAIRGDYWA
jgi:alpha-tubulin suppressor-like RCC1 family protein